MSDANLPRTSQKFPQLKAELKKRYEAIGIGPGRAMLEHFFGELRRRR